MRTFLTRLTRLSGCPRAFACWPSDREWGLTLILVSFITFLSALHNFSIRLHHRSLSHGWCLSPRSQFRLTAIKTKYSNLFLARPSTRHFPIPVSLSCNRPRFSSSLSPTPSTRLPPFPRTLLQQTTIYRPQHTTFSIPQPSPLFRHHTNPAQAPLGRCTCIIQHSTSPHRHCEHIPTHQHAYDPPCTCACLNGHVAPHPPGATPRQPPLPPL